MLEGVGGGGGFRVGGNLFMCDSGCTEVLCADLSLIASLHKTATLNPILHTAWLHNHALTLKKNTVKMYDTETITHMNTIF
jgi:hypothetical protein